jgi:predicted site-specific integrase-resolvase
MLRLVRLGQPTSGDGRLQDDDVAEMASEGRIDGALTNEACRCMVADEDPEAATVACARVSSHEQKGVLDRQVARTLELAAANNIEIDR